jgi:hypothetical protein
VQEEKDFGGWWCTRRKGRIVNPNGQCAQRQKEGEFVAGKPSQGRSNVGDLGMLVQAIIVVDAIAHTFNIRLE